MAFSEASAAGVDSAVLLAGWLAVAELEVLEVAVSEVAVV